MEFSSLDINMSSAVFEHRQEYSFDVDIYAYDGHSE